ncbi:Rv3654c family TadE-like protein [Microbacterium atlanticum]|uniref:Rv3654c family TadE-like protein n=1 Tax=Microbacterium atlanticum TaxID=2782168 RepID=UPI0018886843|nr:Rv3654c family TadE-like protein [Microbacterium atlanticum]
MAGTLAAAALVAGAALLTGGLATVGAASVAGQRLAAAADGGALAAADAASGAVPGAPCERAAEVVGSFGAVLETCAVDELVATVSVSLRVGPLTAHAAARAGPPP